MTAGLLMLSLLLAAPLDKATHARTPDSATNVRPATLPVGVVVPLMAADAQEPFILKPNPSPDTSFAAEEDRQPEICYKIRAFLFKRDDDHFPEFLRETTCGPSQPRMEHSLSPKVHLELLR
jgi:hypothetical protein